MTANDLLKELGTKMGLPQLQLDENGLCRLLFDKCLAIDLEYDEERDHLHLYAVLGGVPAEKREQVFSRLLSAHLFGSETAGAMFAIDALQDEILLTHSLSMKGLDFETFAATLERFVSQVEGWSAKFASGSVASPETASATGSEAGLIRA